MSGFSPSEAVVICTRNRPNELEQTLQSVAAQSGVEKRLVFVVDGSDSAIQSQNRELVNQFEIKAWTHFPYNKQPSSARQRNYGITSLPSCVKIVHFIDDDVTVQPGYFNSLSKVLYTHPNVGGVGGVLQEPGCDASSGVGTYIQSLFLLSHSEPGRVLPSGCTTTAQRSTPNGESKLRETEWLNGCSTYRRTLLDRHRFDEGLTGYSMLEDLDLSYRISRHTRLVVQPQARLLHRRSPCNRLPTKRYSYTLAVHRFWFVEKNLDTLPCRLAFWWSMLGKLIILLVTFHPDRDAALRGFLRGLRATWVRDHELLRGEQH